MKSNSNPIRSISLGIALALAIPAIAAAEDPRDPQKTGYQDKQKTGYQDKATTRTSMQADRSMQSRQHMVGIKDRQGQSASDARREGIIWTTFATNPNLREAGIEVEVRNGTAILTGTVESRVEHDLAEEIANNVNGINRVDNQLDIDANFRPIARTTVGSEAGVRDRDRTGDRRGERDFGTAVSDATTTAQVKSKLLWNSNTSGMDINVDTWNGHVTLRGTVESEASKQLAERLAQDTGNVVAVNNQLQVDRSGAMARRDDTTRTMTDTRDDRVFVDRDERSVAGTRTRDDERRLQSERELTDREQERMAESRRDDARLATTPEPRADDRRDSEQPVNDAWITTKVKSTLLFSRNVDGMDVDVETRNGVVRLSGRVDSNAARQSAIALARDIRGVRNVDASGLSVAPERAVAATDDDDND
jgi:hyperosmotically inducible periplasmic protein